MKFDEWLESRYPTSGKNAWNLRPAFREQLREAWSARDPEVRELVDALRDAIDEVEFWGAYASEYFQEKHDLPGSVAKLRSILAKHESGGE